MSGDNLDAVAFHLGGIGAGSISLNGNGELSQWQIFNQVNNQASIQDTFFAVWAKENEKKAVFKTLQTGWYQPHHSYPHVEDVKLVGEYPIVWVDYADKQLPIKLRLEAFSPFIPLNSKDSALPAIIFKFILKNPSEKRVSVSILASLYNAIGFDGFRQVFRKGKKNRVIKENNLVAIHMSNEEIPPEHPCFGTMTLSSKEKDATFTSKGFPAKAIVKKGILTNDDPSASIPIGENGVLAISKSLEPNEMAEVSFIITWHFPNRYYLGYRIGNMYNNWFEDSLDVARYVMKNFERLSTKTKLFHDTFYDSTLPLFVLDRITANASTIRSPTCMWIENGTFLAFEGCERNKGSCPMNCTHVWNYEQTLSKLFPSLEQNMRYTDLKMQMDDQGMIHHRTTVPLSLPRKSGPATDGQLGTILKVYREHLNSPDRNFLNEMWPLAKRAMEYAIAEWDSDEDGLITKGQPNTYDCTIYGANSFIGSLYLAALRASEEMTRIRGEHYLAERYRTIYEKGRKKLDTMTWNGKYYIQTYDEEALKAVSEARAKGISEHIPNDADYSPYPKEYGSGCFSDQLVGQWWAHTLGLGHILPKEHVRKTLKSIMKYNWRTNFSNFIHYQRQFVSNSESGLLNCTWPNGERPKKPWAPIHFCDEVWTGIEYQVASHLIYEGYVDEGLKIVKAVRERYNGVKRNPWSEVECGEHYARAMSSYSLLTALEGFIYNGPEAILGFKPKIHIHDFKAFFSTAECWGSFLQKIEGSTQECEINLKYGQLNLKTLIFETPENITVKSVKVLLEKKELNINWSSQNVALEITLKKERMLKKGDNLRVSIYF